MPGRGANWRGVGKGLQDRIGTGEIEDESILSEDIKDGTISEADLDSALQTKVNAGGGGGGNAEIVLDATVPSNLVSHTLAFDRSIALDGSDVGLVKIIISDIGLSANDIINIGFNGDSTGMTSKGVSSNGTTVTAVQETSVTDGISWATSGGTIIIEIPGDIFSSGGQTGCFAKFGDNTHYSSIQFDLQSSAFDPLTNIIIKSKAGIVTVNTSTRIVAYAFNKD